MTAPLPPTVSVIINVHNGERYLSEAIESVLAQGFRDFELIVWDNASNDLTSQIAADATKRDSRVVVVRRESKTTLYAARNEAIKASSGEYIAFLDSDDLWRSDKLEVAIEKLQGMEHGVFYSNFEILIEKSNHRSIAYRCSLPEGFIFRTLSVNYVVGISTVVFRREVLAALEGPFSDRFSIIGDYDLILRLSVTSSFASSDEPLMTYRVHDLNLSSTASPLRLIEIAEWKQLRLTQSPRNLKREFSRAHASLLVGALLAGNLSRRGLGQVFLKLLRSPNWPLVLAYKAVWKIKNLTTNVV